MNSNQDPNQKPADDRDKSAEPLLPGTLGYQIEQAKRNPAIVVPEQRPRQMPE